MRAPGRPPSAWLALAAALALAAVAPGAARAQDGGGPDGAGPNANDPGSHGFRDRVARGTEEVSRCAPPAADEPEEVRKARSSGHYRRGSVLYEQGDYQGAVREFVSGYCDLPDPDFHYNIAQTYERLLEFEKAVAYFERFILETEPGARNRPRAVNRVEVLRGMPGRITVATVPPGAEVTLSSDTGVSARTVANRDPIPVPRGTYTMRIGLAGYQPVEQQVVVEIGQPYSYYLRLEPLKGTLRVAASPADARVFLDDRLVGIGSYVETVPIGRYALTVEREGRQPVTRAVVVEAGRAAEVSIVLPERPRSGRRELLAGATVGLGVTSAVALGTLFNQDAGVALGGAAVGLGVGFGAAYLGVPDDIPVGHSSFIMGATVIGGTEGLLLASAVACDDDEADGLAQVDSCDEETLAGVTISAGAAGLLVGALAAPRLDLDAGDAALLNSSALWGTVTGALFYSAFDSDDRVREPLLLAGLNVGLVAGATLAARSTVSRARVALIDLAGLAGIVSGVAVGQAFDSGEERLNHFALVGLSTGLLTGAFLTRNMDDPSTGLGTLRPVVQSDGRTTVLGLGGAL